jgi:hypothetical protein
MEKQMEILMLMEKEMTTDSMTGTMTEKAMLMDCTMAKPKEIEKENQEKERQKD